jgi:hypothetical protein
MEQIPSGRPNKPLDLTPLRGPKIAAFLKVGNRSTAFPIYKAAQLSGRALGHCSTHNCYLLTGQPYAHIT